jgi:hypothetical protein
LRFHPVAAEKLVGRKIVWPNLSGDIAEFNISLPPTLVAAAVVMVRDRVYAARPLRLKTRGNAQCA